MFRPSKFRPLWCTASAVSAFFATVSALAAGDQPVQQAYTKASNADAQDNFGDEIAVSGDTIVVASPREDSASTGVNGNQASNTASEAGAVYVYVRGEDGTWTQQAYLKASNAEADDFFGTSVSISGDTIVVGAPFEDGASAGVNGDQSTNTRSQSGAAYVFVRTGSTWTQQAYLKASNPDAGDKFGIAVAISGDTIVVAATGEDSNATGINGNQLDNTAADSGAAYVFVRAGGAWTQQAYLKAANIDATDLFGYTVGISGDSIIVGAPFEDSASNGINGDAADDTANAAGAAYIFSRSGMTWTQQAYLKASNTDAEDNFGIGVAISGDTAVATAEFEDSASTGIGGDQSDNTAMSTGAAYVFVRSNGVWTQQAYLKASNAQAFDEFGYRVSMHGDQILVGAISEDSNATGVNGNQADNNASLAGAAYLFARSGATWSQQAYLKASNTEQMDYFGEAIAINDGVIVVGAREEASSATGVNGNQADNNAASAGAVYVFEFDFDADGRSDAVDNCPTNANPTQADGDLDSVGDVCDACPTVGGSVGPNGCPVDTDGDGDPDSSDCNDANPAIHAGATEICDGIDNDCDGLIDEGGVCDPLTPDDPNTPGDGGDQPDDPNTPAGGDDGDGQPGDPNAPGDGNDVVEDPSAVCLGTAAMMMALTCAGIVRARRTS